MLLHNTLLDPLLILRKLKPVKLQNRVPANECRNQLYHTRHLVPLVCVRQNVLVIYGTMQTFCGLNSSLAADAAGECYYYRNLYHCSIVK